MEPPHVWSFGSDGYTDLSNALFFCQLWMTSSSFPHVCCQQKRLCLERLEPQSQVEVTHQLDERSHEDPLQVKSANSRGVHYKQQQNHSVFLSVNSAFYLWRSMKGEPEHILWPWTAILFTANWAVENPRLCHFSVLWSLVNSRVGLLFASLAEFSFLVIAIPTIT